MSEVEEKSEGSEEECDQIRESFGSCSDFEVRSKQKHQTENERISKYVGDRISENNKKLNGEKIDSIRDPMLNRVKALKAMARIDKQILQLTVESGSPVSF